MERETETERLLGGEVFGVIELGKWLCGEKCQKTKYDGIHCCTFIHSTWYKLFQRKKLHKHSVEYLGLKDFIFHS